MMATSNQPTVRLRTLPAPRIVDGISNFIPLDGDALMAFLSKLIGFSLRQVLDVDAVDVIETVVRRFSDHSQTLPKALERANDHAWQALGVALAGDGFFGRIKLFFASGDDKGIREQVQYFLQSKAISFEGTSASFR